MKRINFAFVCFVFVLFGQSLKIKAQTGIPYQWKNVAFGGGGFVSGIVTCPTQKDLIYCRTDVGGAYRWQASNSSWIAINDDLTIADAQLQGIESIAINPQNPNKVYIAAGEYTQWTPQSVILRSNNKGTTWKRTNVSFKCGGNDYGRGIDEVLVVDPNSPNILY